MGIHRYRHVRTAYEQGGVQFHIERPPNRLCCPECLGPNVRLRGSKQRTFRSLPIGSRPVAVVLRHQRVECRDCGAVRWDRVDFAEGNCRHTRRFARYVLDLARRMCMGAVASHLQVGWDLVKELKRRYLQRHFDPPPLDGLRHIAIDELAVGRGHRYMTVVLDLDSGAIVYTGDGKGADALHGFWRRLKRSGARVDAVAMDMSQAYINAVRDALPNAAIVFDRFHMVKLVNEKLTDLRRQVYRQSQDSVERRVLKGSRWLLLKRPANLDIERGEWQHLEEVLSLNRPLALAYYLKEELCLLWDQPGPEEAAGVLEAWIGRAHASGIRILAALADTVQKHWHGLLAWFDHPISTGPLEGVNNKIRALTRQAYGFRDREFFRLQLYGLHRTRCELVGASV
jgi:transposase